ncbi:hypothetical protein [Pseudooceanicola algae]|uniref:hypothetical protein n=1 Tax=Pseudooceanicola algae TaxID=1537215 RepID=UPI0018CB6DC8|nr:hypothetical protein [Pseudooceanicola algae]
MLILMLLVPPGTGSRAQRYVEIREIARWGHGNWQVRKVENTHFQMRNCEIWTGGDGIGTLRLTVGDGGADASLTYQPVVFRGMPLPMTDQDDFLMLFDGKPNWIAAEVTISEWVDDWEMFRVDASLSNEGVAEAVQNLRDANTLLVGTQGRGKPHVIDTFLLDGFTATWLKAGEWCGFDPEKRFRTL